MKKGIRCNEVRFTNGNKRDRIKFEFVSDDGVTPSSCTVCVGDIDPMTGEKVTDVTFFREYYRVVDHEVHQNLKAERRELTEQERAWWEAEKKRYIAEFEEKWGYAPSKDNVLFHVEHLVGERWNLSLQSFVSRDNNRDTLEYMQEFCATSSRELEEPVELQALREVAESLTGRKAEVYEAMLQRAAGSKDRVRFVDIAMKWGVPKQQIEKDRRRIMEMVRKRAKVLKNGDV